MVEELKIAVKISIGKYLSKHTVLINNCLAYDIYFFVSIFFNLGGGEGHSVH